MGCDIHIVSEKKVKGTWHTLEFVPFNWRSYGLFGFIADVRNYSAVPPISKPRGIPKDSPSHVAFLNNIDLHSMSWLSVEELLNFNYDNEMEDRRCTKQIRTRVWNGGCTCVPGNGTKITFRDFLGESFFDDLETLKEIGAERIVFCFDN